MQHLGEGRDRGWPVGICRLIFSQVVDPLRNGWFPFGFPQAQSSILRTHNLHANGSHSQHQHSHGEPQSVLG